MKKLIVLVAVIMGSVGAHASIEKVEKEYQDCLQKVEANLDMRGCSLQAYTSADEELNLEYKKLQKRIFEGDSAEVKSRLVEAQRAWIQFRDKECSLRGADMLGGSGENTIIAGCLADKTIQRAKDLREMFK